MEFAWDEAKRQSNLEKHRIDFVDVEAVFEGKTVTIFDDRFDYPEDWFITFGLLNDRVVAIVHTETDVVIRIISVRRATKYEESNYFKAITN
ncbi:MAG: BrnT family toxin [Herpetosiphonaceae bacterium]|nr:BrnT family toxin [Herpetosiphonaceae bacterium]